MRGSSEQVKAAGWLLGILDQPPGQPASTSLHEYRLSAAAWEPRSGLVVRVASLAHIDTPQAIQEVTNVTRSLADIQRCFPIWYGRFLVMRGSDDQIALADWLLKLFDGPAGQGTTEFKVGGSGNQVSQVAYVSPSTTPQSLQEVVNQIRMQTTMQRVFGLPSQKALAMRGTPDQLSRAKPVIQSAGGQ